jgi:hypothetical protein
MNLGMYIMPPEAISTDYFLISLISNTKIAASQIVLFLDFIKHIYYSFFLHLSDTDIAMKGK